MCSSDLPARSPGDAGAVGLEAATDKPYANIAPRAASSSIQTWDLSPLRDRSAAMPVASRCILVASAVGAERRASRLLADLGQGQPEPAELLRHRRNQILGFAQLVEIFEEEPVLTVVTGSPLSTALQQIVGQHRTDRRDHSAHPVVLLGFWRSPQSRPDLIPTLDRAASRPGHRPQRRAPRLRSKPARASVSNICGSPPSRMSFPHFIGRARSNLAFDKLRILYY